MLGFIFLISIFLLIGWGIRSRGKAGRKLENEYAEFLSKNEGLEIFCYTNREKYQDIIEAKLLPDLDKTINVVKLLGKEPKTKLEQRFISLILYRIKNVGFPNVMKIVEGQVIDISLHSEIYNAINNGDPEEMIGLVNSNMQRLRCNNTD
jgi:hypothetical protein